MGRKISQNTRRELLEVLKIRYRESERMEKRQILNEFVAVSGYHRKHAIRLLTTLFDHCIEQIMIDMVV